LLRICPECKKPMTFTGMFKDNGDRELICSQCKNKKWFTSEQLSPEEKKEIDEIIAEQRRNKTGANMRKKHVINKDVSSTKVSFAGKQPSSISSKGRSEAIPSRKTTEPKQNKPTPKQKINKKETGKVITNYQPFTMSSVRLDNSQKKPLKSVKVGNKSNSYVGQVLKVFDDKIKLVLPQYVRRPAQIELAKTVCETVKNKFILLAEAGVGTGKTFAYLIPALYGYSIGPILISTKTISLQEQLVHKDIPLLQKIKHKSLDPIVAKGQSHFLCGIRYTEFTKNLPANFPSSLAEELEDWACETEFGDRSTSPGVSNEIWSKINVDECNGMDCRLYNECGFISYKKRRAYNDGIIVCNHNLLVDDLILRSHGKRGLWIAPRMIIIDEAHGFEDSCRQELSQELSIDYMQKVVNKILENKKISRAITNEYLHEIFQAIKNFQNVSQKYIPTEPDVVDDLNGFLIPNNEEVLLIGWELAGKLIGLKSRMEAVSLMMGLNDREERLIEKRASELQRIIGKLETWINNPKEYYVSGKMSKDSRREMVITISPIDVSKFLAQNLWSLGIPIMLTSGTLSIQKNFIPVKNSLGLDDSKTKEYIGPTNLVDPSNIAIYLPNDLPDPRNDTDDDFTYACAERIAELVKITEGRALILFTSHRRLNMVYDIISAREDIPWTVLKQGLKDSRQLLEHFRSEETSILLATGSYWEGVDVVGPSLSMVIMDKLPFPSPEEPLIKIQEEKAKEFGENPYETIYVPEMLLRLRQGCGRLLRNESDWGIIAILDPRAVNKHYKIVKEALPPGKKYSDLATLKAWYRDKIAHFSKISMVVTARH